MVVNVEYVCEYLFDGGGWLSSGDVDMVGAVPQQAAGKQEQEGGLTAITQ